MPFDIVVILIEKIFVTLIEDIVLILIEDIVVILIENIVVTMSCSLLPYRGFGGGAITVVDV